MFSHGADPAHDASAAGGGVGVSAGGPVVHTRFVWPHGGKRVFLSGSFTRSALYPYLSTPSPSPSQSLSLYLYPVIISPVITEYTFSYC